MFKDLTNPFFKPVDITEMTSEAYYNELAVDVLARTIWGEARAEPMEGMEAVAGVVRNRVALARKKGGYWWGGDIISVCQKPYQFSCWNRSDPNYPKLIAVTDKDRFFRAAREIAQRAVAGALPDRTRGATHYHADYVSPYWAKGQVPLITIGRHIFYRLTE